MRLVGDAPDLHVRRQLAPRPGDRLVDLLAVAHDVVELPHLDRDHHRRAAVVEDERVVVAVLAGDGRHVLQPHVRAARLGEDDGVADLLLRAQDVPHVDRHLERVGVEPRARRDVPEPLERRPQRARPDPVARQALVRDGDPEDLLLEPHPLQLRGGRDAPEVLLEHLQVLLEVAGAPPLGGDRQQERARVTEVVHADQRDHVRRELLRPELVQAVPDLHPEGRRVAALDLLAQLHVHDDLAVRRLRVGLRLVHLAVGEEVLLHRLREPLLHLGGRRSRHHADDEPLADRELGELLARHREQRLHPDHHQHRDQRHDDAPLDHGAFDDPAPELHRALPCAQAARRTTTPSPSIGVPDTTTCSP